MDWNYWFTVCFTWSGNAETNNTEDTEPKKKLAQLWYCAAATKKSLFPPLVLFFKYKHTAVFVYHSLDSPWKPAVDRFSSFWYRLFREDLIDLMLNLERGLMFHSALCVLVPQRAVWVGFRGHESDSAKDMSHSCRPASTLRDFLSMFLSVIQDPAMLPPEPHAKWKTGFRFLLLPLPDSRTNHTGN